MGIRVTVVLDQSMWKSYVEFKPN